MKDFDFLNEERLKIWDRISKLESDVRKKTSDYENEAKQSSKKASEYKNKSKTTLDELGVQAAFVIRKAEEAELIINSIKSLKDQAEGYFEKVEGFNNDLESRVEIIKEHLDVLEANFAKDTEFKDHLEKLNNHFERGDEISAKIETLNKSVQLKKREIDNLYRDIFGYTEKEIQDDGVEIETKVEGLKDGLNNAYNDLQKN